MIWVLLYVSLILAGFGCVFYLSRNSELTSFFGGSPGGSPSS